MAKTKFYVVWDGRQKGIFNNWDDCRRSIEGFAGAQYKSFPTLSEAEAAYQQKPAKHLYGGKSKDHKRAKPVGNYHTDSIAVDAACSGNPGRMEYRGVDVKNREQLFLMGPYEDGTNNVGEFLAIVHALAWLKQRDLPTKIIYTDSKIAIGWVKKKKCGTKLAETSRNGKLFEYIHRAEQWLHNNAYHNPILKWETAVWGEIPADFGRK